MRRLKLKQRYISLSFSFSICLYLSLFLSVYVAIWILKDFKTKCTIQPLYLYNISRYKLPLIKPVTDVNNLRVDKTLEVDESITHRTFDLLRLSMRNEKNQYSIRMNWIRYKQTILHSKIRASSSSRIGSLVFIIVRIWQFLQLKKYMPIYKSHFLNVLNYDHSFKFLNFKNKVNSSYNNNYLMCISLLKYWRFWSVWKLLSIDTCINKMFAGSTFLNCSD